MAFIVTGLAVAGVITAGTAVAVGATVIGIGASAYMAGEAEDQQNANSEEQRIAIDKQIKARKKAFAAQKRISRFAMANNIQRSEEIVRQHKRGKSELARNLEVQERKAIGKEVIRRGEGITAGRSVERSVDDVIATGHKARGEIRKSEEEAATAVRTQAREANANELIGIINNAQALEAGIAVAELSKPQNISGSAMNAAIGSIGSSYATGVNLSKSGIGVSIAGIFN